MDQLIHVEHRPIALQLHCSAALIRPCATNIFSFVQYTEKHGERAQGTSRVTLTGFAGRKLLIYLLAVEVALTHNY